jgi:hypothetical protein
MIVIQFAPDGTGSAVYTDALPLSDIGQLRMQRASTVEFNEASQEWEVRLASAPEVVAYTGPSREGCIAWEVAKLNRDLLGRGY